VEGQAYSAAYWLASQTDEIYLSAEMDGVGSIGAYITLADMAGALRQKGLDIYEIYAPQSTEKNKETRLLFSDKKDPSLIEDKLRVLVDAFHQAVNLKRSVSNPHALAGAVFHGKDAVQANLADGVLSFEKVVARAAEIVQSQKNKNMATKEKNYTRLSQAMGLSEPDLVLTDDHAHLNETQLDALEQHIETLSSDAESLAAIQTELEASQSLLAEREGVIETQTATIAALEERIAALEKLPGAVPTSTAKKQDKFSGPAKPNASFYQSLEKEFGIKI
jgi:protease IV